jgi:hypothetical protein
LRRDLELHLEVVVAVVRILEEDQRQATLFVDRAITVLWCPSDSRTAASRATDDEPCRGARGNRALRLFRRDLVPSSDTGDDEIPAVDGLDGFESPRLPPARGTFLRPRGRERPGPPTPSTLPSQARTVDGCVITSTVARERGDGRRNKSSESIEFISFLRKLPIGGMG